MIKLIFDHSLSIPESSNNEHAAVSHISTGQLANSSHEDMFAKVQIDIDTLTRSLVEINEFWARSIEVCDSYR